MKGDTAVPPKNPKSGLFSNDPAHLGDMMSSIVKAQARMMDSVLKQNIEALDFIKARFEKDREVFNRLAETGDPTKASELLQEYWNVTVRDYTDEAGKLGALASATAEQIVEGMTEEAKALSGGAPRKPG
jgi:hypothetical protein